MFIIYICVKRSEILEALETADKNEEEGIVVKDVASYYIPNKRNAGWYKIKPEVSDNICFVIFTNFLIDTIFF